MTRDVVAVGPGGDNYFGIDGLPSAGGTPGALVGGFGSNTFAFLSVGLEPGLLWGSIRGVDSSTLDYSGWPVAATVNLGNGTNGTASGVEGGTVTGITAVIGSNQAGGNSLNAGSVPDVALTGGIAGGPAASPIRLIQLLHRPAGR
jgi:hypothetical protein